jgi:hypothetical protein
VLSTVVLFKNQTVYLKINIRFQSLLALAPLFFYSLFSFHSAFEQVPPVVSFTPDLCIACASFTITSANLISVVPSELNEKIL